MKMVLNIPERNDMSQYDFGGLEKHPANILRLISELEGSYQLCKYMGFGDDMKVLEEMKGRYYKMYFKIKKEWNSKTGSIR
jgi:hypothetical protein